MVFLKKLGSNFSGPFTSDQTRKKTRCSCLLQTFNSSKYGALTLVLSHARLNKITKSGLLIPFLLGFFKIPACSHTNTYTPIHPQFFVKNIKLAKQVLKRWEASAFTSVGCTMNFSPPLCYMVIYYFCRAPGFSQQWRMFLEIFSARSSCLIKTGAPTNILIFAKLGGQGGSQ